jgi:predicted DCC family thiol-disulfide oxidoreductase YuxK
VLYDGSCGLCARCVRFILDHDRAAVFRFAALQSPLGMRLRHVHGIRDVDSVALIDDGRAWTRSSAVLRIAHHLPWPWPLARALVIVPRPLRDLVYRAIAATRRRRSPPEGCRVASPTERARFLDG